MHQQESPNLLSLVVKVDIPELAVVRNPDRKQPMLIHRKEDGEWALAETPLEKMDTQ